jgi:hypothetical protein
MASEMEVGVHGSLARPDMQFHGRRRHDSVAGDALLRAALDVALGE